MGGPRSDEDVDGDKAHLDARRDVQLDATIVIPTHARPADLGRLLESLAALAPTDRQWDIVIVDDGSPTDSAPSRARLAARFASLTDQPLDVGATTRGANAPNAPAAPAANTGCIGIRVLRQSNAGPASARNRGARSARGRAVVFVDDDCTVEPDWLEHLLDALDAHPDALIASRVLNGLPDSLCASVSMSLLSEVESAGARSDGTLEFVASAAIACDRAAFLDLGGFDTGYPRAAGEDRAFCRAWLASGRSIRRAEAACVHHFHALDLHGFWRQQTNYGRGAARFRRTQTADIPRPMPRGFHRRLLLHPLRRHDWSVLRRLAALPLVALSQGAIARGLLAERMKG